MHSFALRSLLNILLCAQEHLSIWAAEIMDGRRTLEPEGGNLPYGVPDFKDYHGACMHSYHSVL